METITLDLGWTNLVVEKYEADELTIYLQDKKTSYITQDISVIRQAKISHDKPIEGVVECLVWADEDNEDYTDKFVIYKYAEVDNE